MKKKKKKYYIEYLVAFLKQDKIKDLFDLMIKEKQSGGIENFEIENKEGKICIIFFYQASFYQMSKFLFEEGFIHEFDTLPISKMVWD